MDGPASRRKFVIGIVFLGASRWPPQIVIRYCSSSLRSGQRFRVTYLANRLADFRHLLVRIVRAGLGSIAK